MSEDLIDLVLQIFKYHPEVEEWIKEYFEEDMHCECPEPIDWSELD